MTRGGMIDDISCLHYDEFSGFLLIKYFSVTN